MKISQKQQELIDAYKSGKFRIFALGGGTGCVHKDTLVFNPKTNKYVPIKDYTSGNYVRAYDPTTFSYHDVPCEVPGPIDKTELYLVRTRTKSIIVTKAHKFFSYVRGKEEFRTLSSLSIGDNILVYRDASRASSIYCLILKF